MSNWPDKVLHHKLPKYFFGDIERTVATLTIAGAIIGLSAKQSAIIGIIFGAVLFGLLILWYSWRDVMNFFRRLSGAVWGEAIVRLKDAYAAKLTRGLTPCEVDKTQRSPDGGQNSK